MKNLRLQVQEAFGKIFNLNPKKNLGTIVPDKNDEILLRSGVLDNKEVIGTKDYPSKHSSKRYYKGFEKEQKYYKDQNK